MTVKECRLPECHDGWISWEDDHGHIVGMRCPTCYAEQYQRVHGGRPTTARMEAVVIYPQSPPEPRKPRDGGPSWDDVFKVTREMYWDNEKHRLRLMIKALFKAMPASQREDALADLRMEARKFLDEYHSRGESE